MAKDQKPRRPRAETPKGFRDYFGPEVTERNRMLERIAEVYRLHGFEALETSGVETVEALGKFLPDVDRPNAGVFAWQEEAVPGGGTGDWLALRYDLTAPLARVAAQYRNDLPSPYRRYAMGPVWRNEKPGPGRYRQFYQCDADTVGAASVAADAEIIAMLADALEAAGISRGDYLVRVNNRKVLDGVLEISGITDPDQAADVLRQIDKFDKVGHIGVQALLTGGRTDESGAVIKGIGLSDAQADSIIAFLLTNERAREKLEQEALGPTEWGKFAREAIRSTDEKQDRHLEPSRLWNFRVLDQLFEQVKDSQVGFEGLKELGEITDLLGKMGYGPDRIVIDPSVVRGLGYYTGAVFEAELTIPIPDQKGRKRQFGSVAGGGRYDDLVERFTGQKVPATGVSIGVDRLLAALREKGMAGGAAQGPVVVTVMDRDRMADYQAMAAELRAAGIRAEVYLGNPKNFGNQLKYADKRAAPIAIIQGADEAARGVVQVKDLILGAKISAQASVEEWKSQPAQVEVARMALVATVRAMLAR